jgi:hypothetical protein
LLPCKNGKDIETIDTVSPVNLHNKSANHPVVGSRMRDILFPD